MLAVIYLVFNEGYLASGRDQPQRRELAREGLELARQFARLMPDEPEAAGLAALLELHEARAATRFDGWGRLVLLEEQDRQPLGPRAHRAGRGAAAAGGGARPARARTRCRPASPPSTRCARSFEHTDWAAIRALYDLLTRSQPSPVVRLNRAVATRYTHGPAAALAEVDALAPQLDEYRLLHATRAELLRALGRDDEAREARGRALALATNPAERELLTRRLGDLGRLGLCSMTGRTSMLEAPRRRPVRRRSRPPRRCPRSRARRSRRRPP